MTRLLYLLLFASTFLYATNTKAAGWTGKADSYTLATSSISGTSAELSWSGSGPATRFDLRWRKQGAAQWITTSDIQATSFLLTDLEAGQSYEWQLLPAGATVWLGGPATFTTTYTCPVLYTYSPVSLSATAAQLSWSSPYPSTPTDVSTVEFRPTGVTSWSSVTFATPYYYSGYLTNLTPSTTYEWRVRATCSPFSSVATFTTPACSMVDTQVAPLATTAQFRWQTVNGATATFRWRPQGGTWSTVTNPVGNYPAQYQLSGLTPNAVYEYQVQPVCGTVVGTPSAPVAFTASCNAPNSLSLGAITATNATITWRGNYKGFYDFSYAVQYRPITSPVSSWSAGNNYSNTATNAAYDFYTSIGGLNADTPYEVRVQTTCPGPTTSAFTDPPVSFSTTGCVSTASNLYSSIQSVNAVSFNWSGSYENYYAVQYRVAGTLPWTQVGPPSYPGNTSAYIQGLQPGTKYEWQVVTYCSPTQAALPTAIQSFTTAACSSSRLANFSTTPDHNTASVSWTEQYPATYQYVVRYRLAGAGSYTTLSAQSSQMATLTGLTNNTAYEWQVAPVCSGTATSLSFTAPQPFTTTCRQAAYSLSTNGNRGTARQLTWYSNASDYNQTYLVRYRPQGGNWVDQTINSTTTSPVFSVTGLQQNTTYNWELARQCTAGSSSTYTAGPSFTTECRNTLYNYGASSITATKVRLSFSDNTYGSTYQLRYRLVGASNWTVVPSLTNSYYTLTGLTPYSPYEWQVAVQCSADFISDFSPTQTFATDCAVPTGLYASSGETYASFSWSYNENVTAYTLQYRQQNTSAWTTVTVAGNASYYTLNGLRGAYEWRIQADCGGGIVSDFSAIMPFSTYCSAPATPTVSNISAYGATVAWGANSTVARYNLQWKTAGSPTWNVITDLAQSPYVLTGLNTNDAYIVRVQAQCGNAQSVYTQAVGFGASCSAPTALSTAAYYYTTEQGRQFFWNQAVGGSYTLRWRPIVPSGQPAADWIVRENTTTGYFAAQLLPGTYEWQLRRVCVNEATSAFVGGPTFSVPACQTDLITTYASSVESTSATLTYTPGAVTELRWRAVGAGGWNVISQIGYPNVILTGLTENMAYEWQVRVLCPNSLTTAFGPLQTFTASCGPPANLTTRCTTPTTANLSWSGPQNSTYEVNWRVTGAAPWSSLTVTGTQASLAALTSGTSYEWRVRPACSPVSATDFVGPVTFSTFCSAPTGLTIYTGSTCGQAVLSWQGGCMPTNNFTVRVRISYGEWVEYTTSNNSLVLNGLTSSAYIDYQVKASCGTDYSNYSFIYSGSTLTCAPCSPAVLSQSVSSTLAYLSWSSDSPVAELRWRPAGGNWTTVQPTTNSYLLNGLTVNTIYEWQVRNSCAGPADFGPISFFRTRCDAPFTDINGLSVDANNIWFFFSQPGGQAYELRYRAENGAWITQSVADSPAILNGLAVNTRYELQLRTVCSAGVMSGWSPSRYGTTACPIPTRLSADQLTDNSVRLNWRYDPYVVNRNYPRTLRYRPLGSTTWTTSNLNGLPLSSVLSYTLTGLSPQTSYEWQVLYDCGAGGTSATGGGPVTFRTTGAGPSCTAMTTVQQGDWTDAATWSCGRVPIATDKVLIRHTVLIPNASTGRALRVGYETGGRVRMGAGAKLVLGQ
ncbi:fibronectin type III domain-containing protein [Fibrella sp. HMF5335]|uniref:Fibronectin type III domain-containing protein n=1 Tax=Fibrella rubiginis TaxID=2817060 RepID=A0A939K6X0_9BACT|nr:fibronectin type III domain-containing protein [Fibrella rubiginis]MBO0938756.1 fibronectin type III domain-containing protein [Fibrella rubiginis]